MFKNSEIFESAPIPKAVAKLALPTMLTMLVNVLYNMVDTYFIGRTGDPNQVAAVSIATPVFLFLMAAGNIFGVGGSAYISRSLGEKQYGRVKSIASFCCYAGIFTGLLIGAVFIIFNKPILTSCGASANTIGFAAEYLRWIAFGAPFVVFSFAFSNIVRGEGSAKTSMFGQMLGMVVNMILDPIMILGMKMGVRGAAIATVIGNICTCAFYLVYIFASKRTVLSISPVEFRMNQGIFSNVFAIGTPASINNVLMSLSNILMNKFLAGYGDIPIASMGIAMKANMFVVFMQIGLAVGVLPLIGYNYGAKNYKRMTSIIKFSAIANLCIGTSLTILYFWLTAPIVKLFIDNQETISYGIQMVRALQLSMPVIGILFILSNAFQAMGKSIPSMVLSISRQGFVFFPTLILMNRFVGLNGLIYSQPIADIISVFIAIAMFISIKRNFSKETEK
ncbi:MAG: MATE family efflux transporter [Spirochaetaceae bacterium]|nr:MATE family efflux transporter [Spirochaetaceae bacterium]